MGDLLWVQYVVTAIVAAAGSSGLWAFLQHRDKEKTQTQRLLQGLAYDRIISMGMAYIERGWITSDEYYDFRRFLYEPYKALGGNGVSERIMAEVSSLPLKQRAKYNEVLTRAKSRSPRVNGTLDEIPDEAT